jgi:predicted nucleotidyltransferase
MLTILQIQQIVTAYFKDKPVKKVYLFGSFARGEATENSDVDLLVEYDYESQKRASLFDVLRYKQELESAMNHGVDLVSEKAVYHRFMPYIQQEKFIIFEA